MLDVYSMQEAADRIGVTRACLSRWRKEGKGKGPDGFTLVERYNSPVFYLRSVVDAWIAANPEKLAQIARIQNGRAGQ